MPHGLTRRLERGVGRFNDTEKILILALYAADTRFSLRLSVGLLSADQFYLLYTLRLYIHNEAFKYK